jgi:hypothetical protein
LTVLRDAVFLRDRVFLGDWGVEKPVFNARLPSVEPIKWAAEFKNPSTSRDFVFPTLLVRVATCSFLPREVSKYASMNRVNFRATMIEDPIAAQLA